jgi:restriction endonuclease S subunit
LEECNLHTIIRLPNSVFQPYATAATNLLFFVKGTPTKEVWYYEHRLPEEQKSYSKTKTIRLEELKPIKEWWNNRKENEVAWIVDIQTNIERGYDLDIKNPNKKTSNHIHYEETLSNYDNCQKELYRLSQKMLNELNQLKCNEDLKKVINHFDIISKVTNGIVQLKSLIISLAKQGKLVPQYPNNEPASELLEKIKAEKEKLIKEKKIKKEQPFPEIKPDEIPFDIPENWVWCRLGEIGICKTGTTPIVNKSKWENIPIPLPPLKEQNHIIAKIEQILKIFDELEQTILLNQKYAQDLL